MRDMISIESERESQPSSADVQSDSVAPWMFDREVQLQAGSASGWGMRVTYCLSDLVALLVACVAATLFSKLVMFQPWDQIGLAELKGLTLLSLGFFSVAVILGSYGPVPRRPARQFRGWFVGTVGVFVGLSVFLLFFGLASSEVYLTLFSATVTAFFLVAFQRALCRVFFGKCNWWGTRFLILGDGVQAIQSLRNMQMEPQWGIRPIGIVSDNPEMNRGKMAEAFLGRPDQIDVISNQYNVNRAIFISHWFDSNDRVKLITQGPKSIRQWIASPTQNGFPSLWLKDCEINGGPAWSIDKHLSNSTMNSLKRIFDFSVSACVAIAIIPLLLIIALLVRFSSPGPVFFAHERIGKEDRRFKAWKFRTMHPNGEKLLEAYLNANPEMEGEWRANHKLKNDPRITWIGRYLRSTSLDELPQIWNVLVGDMSLVGPRPIVSAEIAKYGETYELYRMVLPGITGMWQVSGRNNTTYDRRLELDTYYVHNWSIWLDFYILACTVKEVLLGEGAY